MVVEDYIPTVVQAVPGSDFTVYAYFTDGTVRLADVKPLIAKGGVFGNIADETAFSDLLTVMNGTVAWDVAGGRDEFGCIDLDPCVLYESSAVVSDPLDESDGQSF